MADAVHISRNRVRPSEVQDKPRRARSKVGALNRTISQTGLLPPPMVLLERTKDDEANQQNRKYSILLDVPGVSLDPDAPQSLTTELNSGLSSSRANVEDDNPNDMRFYKDFRPFFFLCQISAMFPHVLHWRMEFAWCYWGTFISIFYLIILLFLLVFYLYQALMTLNTGLLYVSYNLAWVVHVTHSIDWVVSFFRHKKEYKQIWQGLRKFYRYLLADKSDRKVIRFTWKTFIFWEIMFYFASVSFVVKSVSDRYMTSSVRVTNSTVTNSTEKRTVLATVDQLSFVEENASVEVLDTLFWIHLLCDMMCLNTVFLSEVFIMVLISIIFYAFSFLHERLDSVLGKPDTIFNLQVIRDPMAEIEQNLEKMVHMDMAKNVVSEWVKKTKEHNKPLVNPSQFRTHEERRPSLNMSLTLRAIWEQMEELIDLLDKMNEVFGISLQFLAMEYLILLPALLFFSIKMYPELGIYSLIGFLVTGVILAIRSFVFTSVCARVHSESMLPVDTLYRAYVKGDVSWQEFDLVNMFINRLSSQPIAVRTWSDFPITRQTFSLLFVFVFALLAVLLQADINPSKN